MAYDRFLIAPYSEGLVTALEPWLIPDESFAVLYNAYVWRGRVRKRFGGKLMGTGATSSLTAPLLSRFRVNLGNTSGAGAIAGIITHITTPGSQFSVGDTIFTIWNPAGGVHQMLRTDGSAAAATFNLTTGAFNITGADIATAAYFYPGLPVMGLCNYEKGAINNHVSIGFDTQYVYEFTTAWNRIGVAENVSFEGNDSQFFWTTNWNGITDNQTALFVTNFNATVGTPAVTDDPMWTYNIDRVPQWLQFAPPVTAAPNVVVTIVSARIIIPFKDRLILLNTIEQTPGIPDPTNAAFVNRCRYSHNGSPFAANAFIQVNNTGFDGGGFIDAATEEAIISAEFIKDRLIVYFERSTWELAYTGNQVLPFTWQKINTELGAESTFSVVPFDKAVLGIGNTGVHACNGSNVERIDIKIPNQIFQIANKNEGVSRVAGIRDYYVEMVYWTFPNLTENVNAHFPNTVLIYNYQSNCWAFNDDCITMFGNFEQQLDEVWEDENVQWQENNSTWSSGVQQSQFRQVIAGNQQGYVFIVAPDTPFNAPVMSITNIVPAGFLLNLTIINHTLTLGDFIYIADAQGVVDLNDAIYQIQGVPDPDTVQITTPATFAGAYIGGGNVTRVSRINIMTKQFNPYVDKGRDVYVAKIDFGVLATANGEITIDYFPSATQLSMIQNGQATGTLLGTSVLETFPYPTVTLEADSDRLWHPVYFQSEGECIQLNLYLSDAEMLVPDIAFSDFWLEGMVLHTMATTSRLQ